MGLTDWIFWEIVLAGTMRLATPIALAALGEALVERSGSINLGVDGIMMTGAFAAVVAGAAGGWGAGLGYPAIVLADDGDEIAVHLFVSPDLPAHWARLDAFEGAGYCRLAVTVQTGDGPVEAWIYAEASQKL